MVSYIAKPGGKDILKLARVCDYVHSEKASQSITGIREKYHPGEQGYIFPK
jgi:hypothetical protein